MAETIPAKGLWVTRQQAEQALEGELKPFANLLVEGFATIEDRVHRLEQFDSPFGRVCALVLVKSRNLALGCYSLSLDGLGQESGALCRPLLECFELLMYFRLEPSRIQEAIEGELPKAGVIAKRIEGNFRDLRNHWNMYASHLSLGPDAMLHMILNSGRLQLAQPHNTNVLRENLQALLVLLVGLSMEATNCVITASDTYDVAIGHDAEDLRRRVFALIAKAPAS